MAEGKVTLGAHEKFVLTNWYIKERDSIKIERKSMENCAAAAARDLGFTVNRSHIASAVKASGIPWPMGRSGDSPRLSSPQGYRLSNPDVILALALKQLSEELGVILSDEFSYTFRDAIIEKVEHAQS